MFQIAAKAQKLLQEILSANKTNKVNESKSSGQLVTFIKQEPTVQHVSPPPPQQLSVPNIQQNLNQNQYFTSSVNNNPVSFQANHVQFYQQIPNNIPMHAQFVHQNFQAIRPTFYLQNTTPNFQSLASNATIAHAPPFYYQSQQPTNYYQNFNPYQFVPPPQVQQFQYYQPTSSNMNLNNNQYYRKRKFGEINNFNNNNNGRFKSPSVTNYQSKATPTSITGETIDSSLEFGTNEDVEEDLNIMRERELKDLKTKSIVEKMNVFTRYYHQFKDSYINRVQTIECNDSLKMQFSLLIKHLNEYENILAELSAMIREHERDQCKNNHRKTKKFFNKTKAFVRYECNKRLQSNIFEYRRLINSTDRYAGMYDLLDMNNYLISLLPDIGVSIRRFINRCEKAREQEKLEQEEEDDYEAWYNNEDNHSNDSENKAKSLSFVDSSDFKIPTFTEFVALNHDDTKDAYETSIGQENLGEDEEDDDDEDDDEEDENDDDEDDEDENDLEDKDGEEENKNGETPVKKRKKSKPSSSETIISIDGINEKSSTLRTFESFSKGVDTLNRYLLKRVEDEETLDELVKERIIKWINKRQAKYILIFSEVDKLLNQHKAGECYQKFHSYLQFNLGKLVTVCDSYHQKLKELLYSTTIRRKKKRKKVKLLPESMKDVFTEINNLKKSLEHAKIDIKKCNMSVAITSNECN